MAGRETMRSERSRFWADNGFGVDGGYDEPWQDASFGGIPYAVPNPRGRADALRVHDLHHLLTGYGTDWRGESEIASWELGSGGAGRYAYAWFIALFGFVVGVLTMPFRTWRAFRRGRGASNLYGLQRPMELLDASVSSVRAKLGLQRPPAHSRLVDGLAFVATALVTVPLGLLCLAGTPLLVLLAIARMHCPLRPHSSIC